MASAATPAPSNNTATSPVRKANSSKRQMLTSPDRSLNPNAPLFVFGQQGQPDEQPSPYLLPNLRTDSNNTGASPGHSPDDKSSSVSSMQTESEDEDERGPFDFLTPYL